MLDTIRTSGRPLARTGIARHLALVLALVLGAPIVPFLPLAAAEALTFDEVIAALDETPTVMEARLARQAAEQRLGILEFAGDIDVGLVPSTTFATAEDSAFADRTTIGLGLSADIPLGLSTSERVAREAARDALERAIAAERSARAEAWADLLTRYRAAWLAEQDLLVLQAEEEAAGEHARTVNARFDRGDASLNEVNAAEDELVEAQLARREGTLAARLRRLELLYAAGLERNRTDLLEEIPFILPEIPRPPELTQWAIANDPRVTAFRDEVAAAARERDALPGVVGSPTLRGSFSGWDQSAGVSVNTAAPSLALDYSTTLTTTGSLPETRSSTSDDDTWQLSLSVALPLRTTRGDSLSSDLLATSAAQSTERIAATEDELALAIRARYQQYELAAEAIGDAERSVAFAAGLRDTIGERHATDRATTADLLLAEAQYQRALFRLAAAYADREDAKVATAATAGYLDRLTGDLLP
jgi:outer membrane protein TolC